MESTGELSVLERFWSAGVPVCGLLHGCLASAATTVSDDRVTLASVTSAATPGVLSKAVAKITINGTEVEGLIDSGSSDSFIHPDIVKRYALSVHHSQCAVSMATSTLSAQTSGYCQVNLNVNGMDYHEMRLAILP
ncbi:hypothetical protein Pcinc_035765 [Petrolisthes cinctipes]|uniref:Uncharacterized protein n=1 Tax=Petrolisthes cinctipes TaxID=88211 RepID=A0AAE1BW32_PETCI|nr:hypothetical protein Pcinc_035765 [Petrolisthes cinctipes]